MAEALTIDSIKVPHGFFTRRGGVSGGGYASLNCSLSGQDDSDKVMENRARVARSLGLDPGRLVGLTQVHGTHVVTVTEPWAPGQGEKADAMVTDRPGLGLGIVTADCAPVLFADASAGVVGAAHAGWRGAVAGVLEATISAMIALGSSPERITAAVGPCIAQASYEVGPDLRDCRPRPRRGRFGVFRGRRTGRPLAVRSARVLCGTPARGQRRPHLGYRNRYPGRGGQIFQLPQTHARSNGGAPNGAASKERASRRGRLAIRSRSSGWRDRTAGMTPNETSSGARRHLLQAAG